MNGWRHRGRRLHLAVNLARPRRFARSAWTDGRGFVLSFGWGEFYGWWR